MEVASVTIHVGGFWWGFACGALFVVVGLILAALLISFADAERRDKARRGGG